MDMKAIRAVELDATNFEVTICQQMRAPDEAEPHHSFALPSLSSAVTSYELRQDYGPDELIFDEEDDHNQNGTNDGDDPDYLLDIQHTVSYNVLEELRDFQSLPDDSEMVVRIEYKAPNGDPVFYHEFRGAFLSKDTVSGDITMSKQSLVITTTMFCWYVSLFNLGTK